ncbi:hypothetical protein K8I28_00905 [bacterium]|nr:hypothetical protein [bacterium]
MFQKRLLQLPGFRYATPQGYPNLTTLWWTAHRNIFRYRATVKAEVRDSIVFWMPTNSMME